MRKISIVATILLLLCLALMDVCAAGENLQDGLPLQTEKMAEEGFPCEYTSEELYAERDGKRIYGVIYIPWNAGQRMPAVIFSHGFGGNHQVGTQYAG